MRNHQFLDLKAVNAPWQKEIEEAVLRVVRSGRYVGGPEVEAMETMLAQVCDAPAGEVVGVSSGLDALRLILKGYIALGAMSAGDEVIVPANTYIACFLAVTDCGLIPVPVEPDPGTMNLDFAKIEEAITPGRTKAIMPVHLYGRPCWDKKLSDLAKAYGLKIIEDNAQAIGAAASMPGMHKSVRTGALGDAAAFSFYPTKNVGAMGEAGAVLTHDSELAQVLRALRNYGTDRRYHNIVEGYNCRLDPLQAAIIGVKLAHLEEITARRRELANGYQTSISHPDVQKPLWDSGCVWHQYVVTVRENRQGLQDYLKAKGVTTDIHYPLPPHRQPCYKGKPWTQRPLPTTDYLADHVLSLPIGDNTSVTDAAEISAAINAWQP